MGYCLQSSLPPKHTFLLSCYLSIHTPLGWEAGSLQYHPITVLSLTSGSQEGKTIVIKTVFCQVRISLATEMRNDSKAGLASLLSPDLLCVSTMAMALTAQHFLTKQQDWPMSIFHKCHTDNFSSLKQPLPLCANSTGENTTVIFMKCLQILPFPEFQVKSRRKNNTV